MGGAVSVRIFGHYVSLPLVLLMLAEAAIHVGAVGLASALRFLDIHSLTYSPHGDYEWLLPRALLYALVMLGVMTAFGLYGSALHKTDREYQVRFLASYSAGALVMVIIFYVFPASFLGRGIMALTFLFSLILTILARGVFFRLVGGETLKRRVLVLGSGTDRKSTRLNSSHLVISYAVFCLKKKNKHKSLAINCTVVPALTKKVAMFHMP